MKQWALNQMEPAPKTMDGYRNKRHGIRTNVMEQRRPMSVANPAKAAKPTAPATAGQ